MGYKLAKILGVKIVSKYERYLGLLVFVEKFLKLSRIKCGIS